MRFMNRTDVQIVLAALFTGISVWCYKKSLIIFLNDNYTGMITALLTLIGLIFTSLSLIIAAWNSEHFDRVKGAVDASRLFTTPLSILNNLVLSVISLVVFKLINFNYDFIIGALCVFFRCETRRAERGVE